MGQTMLAAAPGDMITSAAKGVQAAEMLLALTELGNAKFFEDE